MSALEAETERYTDDINERQTDRKRQMTAGRTYIQTDNPAWGGEMTHIFLVTLARYTFTLGQHDNPLVVGGMPVHTEYPCVIFL